MSKLSMADQSAVILTLDDDTSMNRTLSAETFLNKQKVLEQGWMTQGKDQDIKLEEIAEEDVSFKRSNSLTSQANTPRSNKMNSIVERAKVGLSKRKQAKQRSLENKTAMQQTFDEIYKLVDKDYTDLITSLDEKRRNIKNAFKN